MGDAPIPRSRDVFVSYAHADASWVRTLAENLHRLGLNLAFDEWDIGPGDVLIHKLDEMLLATRDGILVVSPEANAKSIRADGYASLMQRAIEHGRRLIPVLLRDAELPPLLASRLWVDFRHADGADYIARVDQLARALKGEPTAPPSRGGELVLPAGAGYAAVGSRALHLLITPNRTALVGDGLEIAGTPPNPAFDFDDLQWRLQRARAHGGPIRQALETAMPIDDLDDVLRAYGDALARAFLPGAVVTALATAVSDAQRLNNSLRMGLEIAEPFADLAWETLRLPQTEPLVLEHGVEIFRRIDIGGPAPSIAIPRPLRILVAIGSPEAQNAAGDSWTWRPSCSVSSTQPKVRVARTRRSCTSSRSAASRRFMLPWPPSVHVLHISCHAAPGTLVLETADGARDDVTAERLCSEAIPSQHGAPLVVLAGCSTARDSAAAGSNTERLPGLARSLIAHGIPSVIAMQAPVGDRYATDLLGLVYEQLAASDEPRPLTALAGARRHLERARRAHAARSSRPAEWATPAFMASAAPLRLSTPVSLQSRLKNRLHLR